jgi:hypothetical protein
MCKMQVRSKAVFIKEEWLTVILTLKGNRGSFASLAMTAKRKECQVPNTGNPKFFFKNHLVFKKQLYICAFKYLNKFYVEDLLHV